jgi:hypothetical protein
MWRTVEKRVKVSQEKILVSINFFYIGDWLQLLRGEDGEIGVSFDKNSSRHFFMLTNISSPRFAIKFKVF